MYLIRSVYKSPIANVSLVSDKHRISITPSTDPDGVGTATEQTDNLCYLFLGILRHCEKFSRKLPKLVNFRDACIVGLLRFGTRSSTSLKYFF